MVPIFKGYSISNQSLDEIELLEIQFGSGSKDQDIVHDD